jgi:hypothetical protein
LRRSAGGTTARKGGGERNQQGEERIIFLMTPPTQQCQLLLKTKKLIHITKLHQKEKRMEVEGRNPIYVSWRGRGQSG